MRRWKFWRDESGQAMVMALGSMTLLMGCLALATDVSVLYRARRMVQTAADAAATAAALDYYYSGSTASAASAELLILPSHQGLKGAKSTRA